jgi:ribosomal protein L5
MAAESMRRIQVDKVVINMGVGESGEKLAKADKLLERIVAQKPIRRTAKRSLQPLSIKKGESIACNVTLRGVRADDFLKRCFKIQNKLYKSQLEYKISSIRVSLTHWVISPLVLKSIPTLATVTSLRSVYLGWMFQSR